MRRDPSPWCANIERPPDVVGNDTGVRAVTDANGFYEFTGLDAGAYGVMEVHPPEWLDGIDMPGNRAR